MFSLPSRFGQASSNVPLKPRFTQLILQLLRSVLIFETSDVVTTNVSIGNAEMLSTLCLVADGNEDRFVVYFAMVCGVEPRNSTRWFRAACRARKFSIVIDSLTMPQDVRG